jgi:hypothetical protein
MTIPIAPYDQSRSGKTKCVRHVTWLASEALASAFSRRRTVSAWAVVGMRNSRSFGVKAPLRAIWTRAKAANGSTRMWTRRVTG